MIELTEDEYLQYRNDYVGFCLSCGEARYEVEPDAENYPCEVCDANNVQGIENLLIGNQIKII